MSKALTHIIVAAYIEELESVGFLSGQEFAWC